VRKRSEQERTKRVWTALFFHRLVKREMSEDGRDYYNCNARIKIETEKMNANEGVKESNPEVVLRKDRS